MLRRHKLALYIIALLILAVPAYAAVFDSNLLPGADNAFDIGSASAKWRNVSLSGLLNFGLSASDPAGAQSGSMYYNSLSNTFRGYQNGTWVSLGGQWSNTSTGIYYMSGVGVNADPISTGLTVKGNVWLYEAQGGINTVSSTGSTYNLVSRSGSGGLLLGSTSLANDFRFQSNGLVVVRVQSDGKTTIGMNGSTTTYMLDVASNGASTARLGSASGDVVTIGNGAGKLNVGTVDPIYSISGQKYATYMPSMTGVREETTGTVEIQNSKCKIQNDNPKLEVCGFEINFSDLEKGSDLWLFWQVTDFGDDWKNLTVLLTPDSNRKVWYKKDSRNKRLAIYGEGAGEVSYRLSAPRYDWQKWPNTTNDDTQGFIVNEK